jgi:superoxide reductase
MAKLSVYKCEICGKIVEVIEEGAGQLVCCAEPMKELEVKSEDEGLEKHVPVVEIDEDEVKVQVGSVEHPMVDNHYIQWIQLIVDGKSYRQFLSPDQKPVATFELEEDLQGKGIVVREYCNVHGLWKKE